MNHSERRKKGLIYNPTEFYLEQCKLRDKLSEYNRIPCIEVEKRMAMLQELFAEVGHRCLIESPVYSSWGCKNIHLGNGVYCNQGVTFLDDNDIFIGDGVLIGPNTVISTAGHTISTKYRDAPKGIVHNFALPVTIGNNVWIGANVTILPGVTVGDNSVIGAGSVVSKDIPANSVVRGNPCRVVREISERDDEYYYKNHTIDIDAE